MTLAEAIASAQKSLDQGDKMGGGPNWTGGGFKSEAIRTLLAQYADTDCQHTETQTDTVQTEQTVCLHCGRLVRMVSLDNVSLGARARSESPVGGKVGAS